MRKQFRPRRPQHGFALLAILAILIAGVLYFVVNSLGPEALEAYRARKTEAALAEARDALVGYAQQYRDLQGNGTDEVYGYLPMPDLGYNPADWTDRNNNLNCKGEGCNADNFGGSGANVTVIGRFPWRALGTMPLRDGNGECLWLVVSGSHQSVHRTAPMNADTPGQLDIVIAQAGSTALTSLLTSKHDRPVAIIVSAGPLLEGQNRGDSPTYDVSECRGNYDVANYLDPKAVDALASVTNYFAGSENNASGDTEDKSNAPGGGTDATKAIATRGSIYKDSLENLWANTCPTGTNCSQPANDLGLAITPDDLFGALRKNTNFRTDINSLLDRIIGCLRDDIAAGGGPAGYAKIAGADNNTCYGEAIVPRGYYPNYKDMLFVARGALTVNGESCPGALLFGNQRGIKSPTPTDALESLVQLRVPAAVSGNNATLNTQWPPNYLEGANLSNFSGMGTSFVGPTLFDTLASGQSANQDIVRCIPSTATFVTVSSPTLSSSQQLADYDPGTRTLTLGKEGITTNEGFSAASLFGCAWQPEAHAQGKGFRAYFKLRFMGVTGGVGNNGFVFAVIDGENNDANVCGAAGTHLGYSGDNSTTPALARPKIGIEFDQGRNANAVSSALNSGRNDPCGTSGCGGTVGYNSHSAIVYWGDGALNYDDNVHGYPVSGSQSGNDHPDPKNPEDLGSSTPGIAFVDYRGHGDSDGDGNSDSYLYHVRLEVTPLSAASSVATARIASISNVDISSPGATLDGVAISSGDRVLLAKQAASTEDGVYVWLGASTPMARAMDADSATELSDAEIHINEGLHSGTWRQTNTLANTAVDAQNWQPAVEQFLTKTWIERDSVTNAQLIMAMQDTTRSMDQLYPGYAAKLSDTATFFGTPVGTCGSGCSVGQTCGADNQCYRQPLKSVRLGFTNSQRTQDQKVLINDFFATWLP